MGRHIGLPLRNGNPTAVPLFHAYAVYHLHPSPCEKRGDSQEGGKPQVVYPLVRPPRAAATFLHAAACEILCRGYGNPLHRRSAVPPPPFRGGFRSVQTVLNDIYPFLNAKNRGQMPSVSCFIARYAKNYFFRTTSPPRPVCAVMYSRPILAYSNGLALAGSCSASTMIQPV